MGECKYMKENKVQTNICYKCGSNEHRLADCPDRGRIQGYPFSKCFICKQVGHVI